MLPLSQFPHHARRRPTCTLASKCNDNFKRARRIPHSFILPISPLPNQGIEAVLVHSSRSTSVNYLLARTPNRSKTIKAWSRASFPRPPLLPHLLHLSSSYSLTLPFSFAPATLPRYSSPLRLNPILSPCPASNPVPSTSDHPIPSPQSPKEPSAKGLIIGFFRAPCTGSVLSHVSCGVSNR